MRKFKKIMLGVLSAITLGAVVLTSTKVNAYSEDNYNLDLSKITVGNDKDVVSSETFGAENNAFLTIENGEVTQRVKNNAIYCIEIRNSSLSVTFQGTGTITVGFCSTGGSNESHFGVTNNSGSVLTASSTTATLVTEGDDEGYYSVTGTSVKTVTYDINNSGKYYLASPVETTTRGCRIYSISMTDMYGEIIYHAVTYKIGNDVIKYDDKVIDGSAITYYPTFDFYNFDGWYSDVDCENAIDSNYTVTTDQTLYGRKIELSSKLDSSNMSIYTGTDTIHYNNTIFNFIGSDVSIDESEVTLPDNSKSVYRINKANSSSASNRLVTFKAPYDGTLTVWAASGNAEKNFYICKDTYSITNYEFTKYCDTKNTVFEAKIEVEYGNTYCIGGDSRFYIYGIFVDVDDSTDTTASVFAEKNESGDTLRFVGTITGITDLDNIDSIELILEKDGVATNSQIFLTTCYTSVTGSSQTCDEADGTYYVIFRLTGVTGVNCTISKQLKITFTDGSTTLSAASEITLS